MKFLRWLLGCRFYKCKFGFICSDGQKGSCKTVINCVIDELNLGEIKPVIEMELNKPIKNIWLESYYEVSE